jgi:hypothetical protein
MTESHARPEFNQAGFGCGLRGRRVDPEVLSRLPDQSWITGGLGRCE